MRPAGRGGPGPPGRHRDHHRLCGEPLRGPLPTPSIPSRPMPTRWRSWWRSLEPPDGRAQPGAGRAPARRPPAAHPHLSLRRPSHLGGHRSHPQGLPRITFRRWGARNVDALAADSAWRVGGQPGVAASGSARVPPEQRGRRQAEAAGAAAGRLADRCGLQQPHSARLGDGGGHRHRRWAWRPRPWPRRRSTISASSPA